MTFTPAELAFWLAFSGAALIAIGVIGEYVVAAVLHTLKRGHR